MEAGIAGQDTVGSHWSTRQTFLVQGQSLPSQQGYLFL